MDRETRQAGEAQDNLRGIAKSVVSRSQHDHTGTMFELERFADHGVVALRGAFSVDEAAAMRSAIWRDFEQRTDVRRHDPATWPRGSPDFNLKSLKGHAVFDPVVRNDALRESLDRIFGGWKPPKRLKPRLLITFPTAEPWVLPTGWHFDGSFEPPISGVRWVQVWGLLDRLEPCGGGTLLLAGSRRLVEKYSRGDLSDEQRPGNGVNWTKFMMHYPALHPFAEGGTPEHPRRELLNECHDVDGVTVQAIELSGDPGDLFISHGDTFHSVAPNTARRPRLMMTGLIYPSRGA